MNGQGIGVDFGFVFQFSKHSSRLRRLQGPHGDVPGKYVRLYLVATSIAVPLSAVTDLLLQAGFELDITGPAASHRNSPVEHHHQTLSDAVCTMPACAPFCS